MTRNDRMMYGDIRFNNGIIPYMRVRYRTMIGDGTGMPNHTGSDITMFINMTTMTDQSRTCHNGGTSNTSTFCFHTISTTTTIIMTEIVRTSIVGRGQGFVLLIQEMVLYRISKQLR